MPPSHPLQKPNHTHPVNMSAPPDPHSKAYLNSTEYLLGHQDGCFVGYATDPATRANAASGGVVSAITRYLLQKGIVKGVLASRLPVVDSRLDPQTIIARSVEELEDCKNSIYLDHNLGGQKRFHNLLEELETPGKVAVVGLFCHLTNLKRMMEQRGVPSDRIVTIGLFCSHAPDKQLIHEVLDKVGADMDRAKAYHTKTGHGHRDGRLHGKSTLEYKDGENFVFPFIKFTTYKNAWFMTHRKCLLCPDQFSEVADISCGDAWYKEIRKHPLKQTTMIARSPKMRELIMDMVRDGYLELRTVDPASVVYSQRRVTGVSKVARPARSRVARWFGYKLPEEDGRKRFIDYFHSFFMMANIKLSESRKWKWLVFFPPTWLMLGYVLFMKLIEQRLLSGIARGKGVGEPVTVDQIPKPVGLVEKHAGGSN